MLFDYDARIVSLHGHVTENDFIVLTDQLLRQDTDREERITIYLSARGGNIVDALTIIDVIENLRSSTEAIAFGMNEGASVMILAAAQKRIMLPSALLDSSRLWHLPQEGGSVGWIAPRNRQLVAGTSAQAS